MPPLPHRCPLLRPPPSAPLPDRNMFSLGRRPLLDTRPPLSIADAPLSSAIHRKGLGLPSAVCPSSIYAALYREGCLDEQFTQLQQLQDESNQDFVFEVVTVFYDDSEKLLKELGMALF